MILYRGANLRHPAALAQAANDKAAAVELTRPNQVWAMDITYIPMARGFVYLAAVVDRFSRKVLAWKLSVAQKAREVLDRSPHICSCGAEAAFGYCRNEDGSGVI